MIILQINSVCGVGSTGRIATDIHAILEEKGHESYIAYGRGNPIKCNSSIKIGNNLDNYMHVAKTRILDMHGFGSKRATKGFIEKIKLLNPDVIHLHNIHGYYINVELLFEYLKSVDIPVIWTLHDCWAFTGHCAYFDYSGCNCWKVGGSHKCIQKKSYPTSLLLNNSTNNYKRKRKSFTGVKNLTIVTPSKWLAEIVKQSFLSEYPVTVINNGIDLDVFKPCESIFKKEYNLRNKFIILGVASVWDNRKGLGYFIQLSKEIKNDEVIVLVGLTEQQIKTLPKNIIGISKTNSAHELANIYSCADVFINTTLEDNFPTTNIEALACGTPVVTFRTGGSVESIDKSCGIVAEKGNVQQLIDAICKIKSKMLNIENCVKKGNSFDKNKRFSEYLDLYKQITLTVK
jgi:putative colanic acid biosynthesis glycosyltransferase